MKHYYIVARKTWENFPKEHMHSTHWIETDDPEKLLVVAQFHHESAHELWERTEGVESLPHLLFGMTPLKPEHHVILGKIGVKSGDRTLDVAMKAAKEHPMFRPDRG
jgi:hypothetical protein